MQINPGGLIFFNQYAILNMLRLRNLKQLKTKGCGFYVNEAEKYVEAMAGKWDSKLRGAYQSRLESS